jgi:hypothetical protein
MACVCSIYVCAQGKIVEAYVTLRFHEANYFKVQG